MNDPSKSSHLYDGMAARWALPHALMGGTLTLRAAGTRYLPRHPAENSAIYAERASRSVLRNYFRRTVQKLVGRVFAEPLILSEDIPEELVNILKNIDLLGRGLNAFARDWFEDALVSGLSHVLVDFPSGIDGASLAEEKAERVHAFASPRLGNREFAEGYSRDIRVTRYVNRCDVLARLPISGDVQGSEPPRRERYCHIGRTVRLPAIGHSISAYIEGIQMRRRGEYQFQPV